MIQLQWDSGSAYDLFISLHVLHQPVDYGLRKAWAKGVRARLSSEERTTLERCQVVLQGTLHWVHSLPAPKDSAAALATLAALPPAERLPALSLTPRTPAAARAIYKRVAAAGHWNDDDVDPLHEALNQWFPRRIRRDDVKTVLNAWADAAGFGQRLLKALQAYHDVFFAEEEARIRPVLLDAYHQAQTLATRLTLAELLQELSQGVHFAPDPELTTLVLVPSFWSTPFIVAARYDEQCLLLAFGARPVDISLVPGEPVPDALYQALKALADPTRLRILRYLARSPMTPAELARRLRLRAPTVTHHLHILRLARQVEVIWEPGDKRRFALRRGAIGATFADVERFLADEDD